MLSTRNRQWLTMRAMLKRTEKAKLKKALALQKPIRKKKSVATRTTLKHILIDHDLTHKKIAERFGVSREQVANSLHFRRNSKLSKRIRAYVLGLQRKAA